MDKITNKERYATDAKYREKRKIAARKWYHKNKKQICKLKIEQRHSESNERKVHRKELYKNWSQVNKDTLREKQKAYAASPEGKAVRKAYEESSAYLITTLIRNAKIRAKKKGLEFSLTKKDIVIPDLCPILNIPLERAKEKVKSGSISLDRINSELGYTADNVHVISFMANTMKSNASPEELLLFAKWINSTYG